MTDQLTLGRGWARWAGTLAALSLSINAAMAQPIWSAATLPADGNIGAAAGAATGWGYEIANPEATLWLVLTGASADPFQHATPLALFDLPVLAPGDTRTQTYDGVQGLYGMVWDASAPLGFVNTGQFLLTAEWWNGDQLSGGTLAMAADDILLAYTATVTQPGVLPEPAPLTLIAGTLLAWGTVLYRRRRGRTP
jgi:hypothetical protein